MDLNKVLESGVRLKDYVSPCSYLEDRDSTIEGFLIQLVDDRLLEELLESGYRHFGYHYFRPVCAGCHRCIPIRIPLEGFRFSRSAKRLFRRNAGFVIQLHRSYPSRKAYELYRRHNRRFENKVSQSFEEFSLAFFYPSPWAYQLSVWDNDRLVAVSHLDITANMTSAVYTYYEDSYRSASLGTFLIFKAAEIGLRLNQRYLYLGYYVHENRHMNYKVRFRPNQLLLREGEWIDYMDSGGDILHSGALDHGFTPHSRLHQANPVDR